MLHAKITRAITPALLVAIACTHLRQRRQRRQVAPTRSHANMIALAEHSPRTLGRFTSAANTPVLHRLAGIDSAIRHRMQLRVATCDLGPRMRRQAVPAQCERGGAHTLKPRIGNFPERHDQRPLRCAVAEKPTAPLANPCRRPQNPCRPVPPPYRRLRIAPTDAPEEPRAHLEPLGDQSAATPQGTACLNSRASPLGAPPRPKSVTPSCLWPKKCPHHVSPAVPS